MFVAMDVAVNYPGGVLQVHEHHMSIDKGFFRFGFQHGRAYEQSDRERIAELNAPPPRTIRSCYRRSRCASSSRSTSPAKSWRKVDASS